MKSRKPRLLIAIWLVAIASAFAAPIPADALTNDCGDADPATTCVVDEQGANDQPGQKDLTEHLTPYPGTASGTLIVGWNWDEVDFSGNNSGDACALFDTDGDGKVNFAVCVTVKGSPAQKVPDSPRVYSCGDAKVDRCTTPTLITNTDTNCSVTSPSPTDPFNGTGKNRGDAYPNDTRATCTVYLSDVGGADSANLVNTCSYPSQEPNSDPSDCVLIIRDAFVRIVKNSSPESGTFPFTVDSTSVSITTTGTAPDFTGSRTVSVTSGNNTSHTITEQVPAGWTLETIVCDGGSPTYTSTSATVRNIPADTTVECTFTDTRNRPALSLVKTASPQTYDSVSDVISYSYLVTNTGNVTLAGPVTVADDKATVTCPAVSSLAPGASVTCTASYTITQADLDSGSVTNVAKAHAGGTDSNEDTETVTAVRSAALSIVKTATPATYSAVGQTISYSYLVTNTGNVTLAGPVTVADDKATVTCPSVSSLAPGASVTCSASYVITQADLNNGSVTNTATATAGGTTSPPDSETVTAVKSPALRIVKTASPTTYDSVGDVISYSFVVTNTGNVSLAGPVTVADDKAADELCPTLADGFLDPGESITCTASYTITQTDLNNGSVTNTATATAGGTTSPPDSETVTAVKSPALRIVKTASPTTYDSVGDVISYSFVVTNTGNVSLAGPVTVADDKAADELCPTLADGFLDPGESITCTASYTITQTDLNNGSVTNRATATAGGTTSPPDTETVNAIKNPALTMVKSASPATYDSVGDVIEYSYTVENTGNVRLEGPVSIDDDITTDEFCPLVTSVGNGDAFLDPGEIITCTSSYTITQDDLNNGSVTNTATASADDTTSPPDSEKVDAVQNRSLSLVKTASPQTYDSVGDVIGYSYLVTNTGNVSLDGPVTIVDDKATVTCTAVTVLDPGQSVTCTASYTITQTDLNNGSVTNTATATADGIDSNPDSETVTADQKPALTIEKSADPTTYDSVGEVITYSYVVTNSGNVRILGPVTVSDDITTDELCPDVDTVGNKDAYLDPGESITCHSSYTITQDDLNNGSVTNTATAHAGDTTSPPDHETVTANQVRSLSLVKTASPQTYDSVGDVIGYSYLVTNTGNVSLDGPVTIVDDKATVTCTAVTVLDPGQSVTCTASYTITQTDLNNGSVTNTATATADGIDSNPDSETVRADQNPSLKIEKSADVDSYDSVGDVINYEYVVTNTGNVSLAGPVTIDDDITSDESCPAVTVLNPGDSVTCTSSYTITQDDLNHGEVKNAATAHAGDTTSPPDTVTVPADQNPSLKIVKSADVDSYDSVGDIINYSYVVTNDGNVSLEGPITVSDDITTDETCPDVSTVGNEDNFLDPDESITCTSSYTITQEDIDRGSVTNAATASNGTTTSPPDTVTVPADQNPHIDVEKTGTLDVGDDGATVGDEIKYTITVTNDGNVTLDPVTVVDTLLDNLECDKTSLPPGGIATCEGTYVITQADIDAGKVTNTATGTGKPPTGPNVTDSDTFEVLIGQNKDMTVAKTMSNNADQDESGTITEGDHITYTITVHNSGNVTLTNVTVTDPVPTQTTYVSCGPVGITCSQSGGTVTWTIASIAPGQSVPVTLTVRVGMITSCQICNTAHAISAQIPEPGRDSPELCIQPLPIDHPDQAHASGSALGAKVRVDLLNINQDIVPVSSSQSGVGHDGDDDSVLSLAVPPPGGAIAKLGLITTTTSSTVTAAPARAMDTGTAETLGVNLLAGTITADVVRGVAHAEANGVGSFISSAGSTFVNLKVSGVTMANVAPNTTVNLPALLFGKGSYVKLYEKVGGTSFVPGPDPKSGGTYAADLTVNMIHVFVKDALPIVPGNQTAEIIVSGATAHADFPQTTVCAVQPARSVSGHAFIASAAVTVDDPEDPLLLGLTEGFVGIPASGGHDHQELPSVVLLEPDGEVLNTEDVSSDSAGNIFGPTITASSYAQAAHVCLLEMANGCTVRATLVKSQSNSSAASSGPPGAPTSNPTGTQLVGLEIAGNPINVTPPPNTVINIPGVGFIILNEQFCDGGGTPANNCTDGLHSGLTVRAIRIVVTLLQPLGVGAEVIVAEAHSDVTRPPYPA